MASNVGYSSVTSNVGANLNDKALTVDGGGYVRHRTPKHLGACCRERESAAERGKVSGVLRLDWEQRGRTEIEVRWTRTAARGRRAALELPWL